MKKIYFTQINNIIAEATFLPLSVAYVWEFCKTQTDIMEHWELGGIIFERDTIENYVAQIQDPDILAISTYVWNWQASQDLAKAVKEKYPDCTVVMGGPQVPYKRQWLEDNSDKCDIIITYAGERTFAEILRGNLDTPGILSLDYEYKPPKPDKVIEDIPSPYLSGLMDSLMDKDKKYSAIIETNRGCPYQCTFCDQEALYYNKIAKFEEKRVLKEIDWVSKNKIDFLYFADSNLGIFERDLKIMRRVAKNKVKTGYPRNIDYATAKQSPERVTELGKILNQEAGISRGMTIALQSMNPATLSAIKRVNAANDKLKETIDDFHKNGVDNYCELILGLPEESFDSWIDGIGQILDIGSDHALQMHPLSIVPNTPFMEEEYQNKYGLQYTPTPAPAGGNTYPEDSNGEIDYICYASNTMSQQEWIDCYFFTKGIVIPHHYHGFSQVIATYLNKEHDVPLIEYYKFLFEWSRISSGILNKEYVAHTTSVKESLFESKPWGRPVYKSDDNFHMQDNGATASWLYTNIDDVYKELRMIVNARWNLDITELLQFNKHILDRYDRKEDKRTFSKNYTNWFFKNDPLMDIKSEVTVTTKKYKDILDHAKHLFWYGRKAKRCFLDTTERKIENDQDS